MMMRRPPGSRLSAAVHGCDHGEYLSSLPTVADSRDISAAIPLALIVARRAIVTAPEIASFWTARAARSDQQAEHQLAVSLRI